MDKGLQNLQELDVTECVQVSPSELNLTNNVLHHLRCV